MLDPTAPARKRWTHWHRTVIASPPIRSGWRRELKWILAMIGAVAGVAVPRWALELSGRAPVGSIWYPVVATALLGSVFGFLGGWWTAEAKSVRSIVQRLCLAVLLMVVMPVLVVFGVVLSKK